MSRRSATMEVGALRREGAQVIEMQRRRLILAMGEVTFTGGLEAATVGRVCEHAGVSRRTFYELFEDREGCLLAALDHAASRMRESVLAACGSGSWRERVRAGLLAVLEQIEADPHAARLCLIEAPRAGLAVQEYRRRVLEELAAVVDAGRKQARRSAPPPPLTAQGVVGGVLAVIHARLIAAPSGRAPQPLIDLVGSLTAMIVHPYLGAAAAQREIERPSPVKPRSSPRWDVGPFRDLPIRFTYRTARVLSTIASEPGASNRCIADRSGVLDEGQMSRLLGRLSKCGLIENRGEGHIKGEPNAWTLTARGEAINSAIAVQGTP